MATAAAATAAGDRSAQLAALRLPPSFSARFPKNIGTLDEALLDTIVDDAGSANDEGEADDESSGNESLLLGVSPETKRILH